MISQGLSNEAKIELEFFKQSPPLESDNQVNGGDWISSIKFVNEYTITSDYSGDLQKYIDTDQILSINICKFPIKCLDITTETNNIAITSKKGEIKVLDLDFNILGTGHTNHAEKLVWNPTGTSFALGTFEGKIQLCKVENHKGYIQHGLKKQEIDNFAISVNDLEIFHTDAISDIFWPTLESLITSSLDHNIFHIDLERSKVSASILCPRVSYM